MRNKEVQSATLHESGEDYLERILMLQQELGEVRSIDLANSLKFSRPAISKAIKILVNDGYVNVGSKGILTLTASGLKKALRIYDRHKTLTQFFIKIGVDPKIAEHDACKIEHDIDQSTFVAIEKLLSTLK